MFFQKNTSYPQDKFISPSEIHVAAGEWMECCTVKIVWTDFLLTLQKTQKTTSKNITTIPPQIKSNQPKLTWLKSKLLFMARGFVLTNCSNDTEIRKISLCNTRITQGWLLAESKRVPSQSTWYTKSLFFNWRDIDLTDGPLSGLYAHPQKKCGQWLDVWVESSEKWCPSEVSTGSDAV